MGAKGWRGDAPDGVRYIDITYLHTERNPDGTAAVVYAYPDGTIHTHRFLRGTHPSIIADAEAMTQIGVFDQDDDGN